MATKRKHTEISQAPELKFGLGTQHKERLIVRALLGLSEEPVRLLVDSGATGPILNQLLVQNAQLATKKRRLPLVVTTATGEAIPGAGELYIPPISLRVGKHLEMMAWEVGRIEDGIDGYLPISWLKLHNPDIDWERRSMKWRSKYCRKNCLPARIEIREIDAIAMELEMEDPHIVAAVSLEWEDNEGNDIRTKLPKAYWSYAEIFTKKAIDGLAQHSQYDHTIELQPGSKPTFGPIYKFSDPELAALKEWLEKYEANGRVVKSKSAFGAPILLVKKADGTF